MKMMFVFAFGAVLSSAGASASAGVSSTVGLTEVFAPFDFSGGSPDDNLYLVEQQGFTLTSDLEVDTMSTGFFDEIADLDFGTIAAGTTVNSYLIEAGSGATSGSIRFENEIIVGVIGARATGQFEADFAPSDALLGLAGVTYSSGVEAFELDPSDNSPDTFTILGDRSGLDFTTVTGNFLNDRIRIITVPTPGTVGVLVGAGVLLRRRRV